MMKRYLAVVGLGLWMFIGSVSVLWAQGDPSVGQTLSQTCAACHGADGNSSVPLWPKLAGQHESYLIRELKFFKQGESGPRYEPQMLAMVASLSDQDIQDLAAYFSGQTMSPGQAKSDLAQKGERIYRGGIIAKGVAACTACHGPQGLGNEPASYPKLNGQHAEYTAQQLKNFKAGLRKTDENAMMQMIAGRLTDDEIEAVSEYIAGLH